MKEVTNINQVRVDALLFKPTSNQWFKCTRLGKMRDIIYTSHKAQNIPTDGSVIFVGYMQSFLTRLNIKVKQKIREDEHHT